MKWLNQNMLNGKVIRIIFIIRANVKLVKVVEFSVYLNQRFKKI